MYLPQINNRKETKEMDRTHMLREDSLPRTVIAGKM